MSVITGLLLGGLVSLSAALALLPRPSPAEVARLRTWVYRSVILAEWGLVALFGVLLVVDGQPVGRFGLRLATGGWRQDLLWGAAATLFAIALGELWWAWARRQSGGTLELMQALLPRTRGERWLALGLAATAGLCEEFLFRGFVITVLNDWWSNYWAASAMSVLMFALAHAPSGKLGVLSALTGGVVLAAAFVSTGRLTAPVLAHTAYDCYALFSGRFDITDSQRER